MKLTMLGTGNAMVTECYNTCFVLSDNGQNFMIDGGGGNTVLRQLKQARIDWHNIQDIFVTHKHVDHLMGIIWMVRMICQHMHQGQYEGEANIYGHEEVIELIEKISKMLLSKKHTKLLGKRLHLITVKDGETCIIQGKKVTFFDIQSKKAKQFGFMMELGNGEKLTCCGDEPYRECERQYAENSTWLLHEAFCLDAQADVFHPYEKQHSTVKDACEKAEQLGVKNLVLYHTEDSNIEHRKIWYAMEGKQYFHGKLYIPDDLEVLEI